MRTFIIALTLAFSSTLGFAQEHAETAEKHAGKLLYKKESKSLPSLQPARFSDPRNPERDPFDVTIKNLRKERPNPSFDVETSEEQKKNEEKVKARARRGNLIEEEVPSSLHSSVPDLPKIDEAWQCNFNNTSAPPDGASAVSQDGYVVTANNAHVEFFDSEGTILYSETDATFWFPGGGASSIFDPRALYSPVHDKFVMVVCNGNSSSLSEVVIAYSVSSNPMDGWYIYVLNANPGDLSEMWFDYPSVGQNGSNLFISGNMFNDDSPAGFQTCSLFQIDLTPGFTGGSLDMVYWDDVEQALFNANATTVVPVSYPFGSYGPGAYCVSASWSQLAYNYYEIDADLSAPGDPNLSAYYVGAAGWNNPSDGTQLGSPAMLDIGSARILSAYYGGNGKIHFVQHVEFNGDSDAAIRTSVIDVTDASHEHETFGVDGMDYAYPWIMPWAKDAATWDGSSLIGFLRSSSSLFPEFRVVTIDSNLNFGSSVLVKSGESPIGTMPGVSRWGDYIAGSWRAGQNSPACWVYGQYGRSNAYATYLAEVVLYFQGCTDPSACNFDPQAEEDDGSCDFNECSGCMDAAACNYDAAASLDDDSCLYPGCTDITACNFEPLAGCNNGSCCYQECIAIDMTPAVFNPLEGLTNEMSYTITDNETGEVLFSGSNGFLTNTTDNYCIPPGCYTLEVITSGTPNWELRYDPLFFLPFIDYTIFEGNTTASGVFIIGDGGSGAGCTDPTACNYEPDVACDNGTCCYDHCLTIDMTSTSSFGWNSGNNWTMYRANSLDPVAIGTLSIGTEGQEKVCLEAGCYLFRISAGGIYPQGIGWTISGHDDEPLSGGYLDEVYFTIGGGGTDLGCTDPGACNFSSLALCDDGKCCYDNCGTLTMTDAFGDGWNGGEITISKGGEILYLLAPDDGFSNTSIVCLPDGCYRIEVSEGMYPEEIGWSISFADPDYIIGGGADYDEYLTIDGRYGCTDAGACNFDEFATCDDGSCTYPGCLDPNACNYYAASACDGYCDYECFGCTYPDAMNYDAFASEDDGGCQFDCVSENPCPADLDGDGAVASGDLLMLLSAFGTSCSL